MKKVVGYIRCSTNKQVVDGDTLRNQRIKIEDWCKQRNYELITIFEDGGKSGGAKVRSNTFNKMMDMVDIDLVSHLKTLVIWHSFNT